MPVYRTYLDKDCFFKVKIFDTLEDMHKFAYREVPKGSSKETGKEFYELPLPLAITVINDRSHQRELGTICLVRDFMTPGTIGHEATHAASHYLNMSFYRRNFTPEKLEKLVEKHPEGVEEKLAYSVSSIIEQICDKMKFKRLRDKHVLVS